MPKKNILIIAPHPDDETLGCGGTIFKHKKKGDNVFLVIITSVKTITDSNGNIKLHNKQYSIIKLKADSYNENEIPEELSAIPIQKPGSRYS